MEGSEGELKCDQGGHVHIIFIWLFSNIDGDGDGYATVDRQTIRYTVRSFIHSARDYPID